MIHVLFVCSDNICRSPMAEFIMKDLVKGAGLESSFHIESAATVPDEIGNMIAAPARCLLAEHGVGYSGKSARLMQPEDYPGFDFLIGMDWANLSFMDKICGGDPEKKFCLLLDFTEQPGEIEDPGFSGDYQKTWREIRMGCEGLFKALTAGGLDSGGSRRILCYGDSNTYGYDPRSLMGERYPEIVRWTALLHRKGWLIFNEGVSGRSIPHTDDSLEDVRRVFQQQKWDAAVVMLGTNDLLHRPGLTSEMCGRRMEHFLTHLLEQKPSYLLILTAPPVMVPGAWVEDIKILEESRRLPECYREIAQKLGIGFANAAEWNISLTFDGVHFSKNGHRTFAAKMHRVLYDLLER